MITPQVKDAVLKIVCNVYPLERYVGMSFAEFSKLLPDLTIKQDELFGILNQFQRIGIIQKLNAHPRDIAFIHLLEADDLLQRGGFTIQEELFQSAYNKLQLEVESLAEDFPQRAERFASILANFATVATFFGLASHQ